MTVLIFSVPEDSHARAVIDSLTAHTGVRTELIDLREFPSHLSLSMKYEGTERRFLLRRPGSTQTIELDDVHSAWWRRPQVFSIPDVIQAKRHRDYVYSESATAFQGLYQSMNVRWLNPPAADAAAGHKGWQLTMAQSCGLAIPPTLMTNSVEEAREFWHSHPGQVIYKQFIALPHTWRETRRLTEGDMALAQSIALAPIIFQRHVPAVADLRIIAIGETLFAAATNVSDGEYPQDVRFNANAQYEPHELPEDIAKGIREMMQRMNLSYGAIDMRLTPEGQYIFLEINPAGQFLYIEDATGQPITKALASYLVN